jgi:hypothetical protein
MLAATLDTNFPGSKGEECRLFGFLGMVPLHLLVVKRFLSSRKPIKATPELRKPPYGSTHKHLSHQEAVMIGSSGRAQQKMFFV